MFNIQHVVSPLTFPSGGMRSKSMQGMGGGGGGNCPSQKEKSKNHIQADQKNT